MVIQTVYIHDGVALTQRLDKASIYKNSQERGRTRDPVKIQVLSMVSMEAALPSKKEISSSWCQKRE